MVAPGSQFMRSTPWLAVCLLLASLANSPASANPISVPQCADGVNNDLGDDGYDDGADFPQDPDCETPWDDRERGPSCSDHIDNDRDGGMDSVDDPNDPRYPMRDPDCDGPTDDSEDPGPDCQPPDPTGCGGPNLCSNLSPPTGLRAQQQAGGVLLEWQPSSDPQPEAYLIYRVQLGTDSPSNWDPLHEATQPRASTAGQVTWYFDESALIDATYAYWVTAAGPGCQSMASNPALVGPNIPDTSDCVYVQSFNPPRTTNPSLNCIQGIP